MKKYLFAVIEEGDDGERIKGTAAEYGLVEANTYAEALDKWFQLVKAYDLTDGYQLESFGNAWYYVGESDEREDGNLIFTKGTISELDGELYGRWPEEEE